jgi:hypothetical protein
MSPDELEDRAVPRHWLTHPRMLCALGYSSLGPAGPAEPPLGTLPVRLARDLAGEAAALARVKALKAKAREGQGEKETMGARARAKSKRRPFGLY